MARRGPHTSHRWRPLTLAAVLLAAAGLLAGCSGSTPAAVHHGPTITMADLSFSPKSLTVAPGATVTVTNNDEVTHNVTSTSHRFASGDVAPGSSRTFTAPRTPGRYPYTCTIHPFMRAVLVVR